MQTLPLALYPPICLHTTLASSSSQPFCATTVQLLSRQISTVPSNLCFPPTSRISPSLHAKNVKL